MPFSYMHIVARERWAMIKYAVLYFEERSPYRTGGDFLGKYQVSY